MRTLIALLISAGLAAGSSVAILSSSPPVGSPPYGFLIDEGFEGTGTPSGWGGSADFDSTTSPLVGAQSLRTTGGTTATVAFADQADVYIKFRLRVSAVPAVFQTLLSVWDITDFSQLIQLHINSDGTFILDGQGIYAATVAGISSGTIYDVWIRVSKGTGSNSVARVWFATAGSAKPADGSSSSAGASNGTQTRDVDFINAINLPTVTADFDSFQVGATDF